jgi:hypothetical protein
LDKKGVRHARTVTVVGSERMIEQDGGYRIPVHQDFLEIRARAAKTRT